MTLVLPLIVMAIAHRAGYSTRRGFRSGNALRVTMMPRRSICGLIVTLALASTAQGQNILSGKVVFPDESFQARNRLPAIDHLLDPIVTPPTAAGCVGRLGLLLGPFDAAGAMAPAVSARPTDFWERVEEAYHYLIHDSGDALVSLPDAEGARTAHTSLQVRRLCHIRLAQLPAAGLAAYRQRVDAEAQRLLALGRKNRDPRPLRQLVDELFCSTSGAEALDLLGDLAFERGDFNEARHWWRMLAPLPAPNVSPSQLRFPGRNIDIARIEAKQILALAFQGSPAQAQMQLDRFHERFPQARGALAGKQEFLSEIVQAALRDTIKAGLANNADPWATFAGSDTRNHVLSACPPARLWEDGPSWRVALPSLDRLKNDQRTTLPRPHEPTRRIAFHPIIVGQQVLLADAHSVTSYHLATGRRLFRYDLKGAGLPGRDDRSGPMPRFTLSADRGRVYARLGRQWLAPAKDGDAHEPSFIVCLDLAEPDNAVRPRELWHVKAQGDQFFEGTPLVRHGRAYVALSRLVGKRVVTAIQCYDALGRLRWSCDVCDCPEFEENAAPRYRQHLLTWAGGQLVYCTHAGAVVAVDPWTGQSLWAVRYASRGPLTADGNPSPRDLAPCVAGDGRIFVAPLDSDRLYCLESSTGQVLWERDGCEAVHVLGATRGRVFLTTRQGLQAVSTTTGQSVWQQPSEGRLAGLGRPLLAGGWLFWPTQDTRLPLRTVTLAEGRQQQGDDESPFAEPSFFDPTQLRLIPPGNLALGNNCLVVAGTDELLVFAPSERLPPLPAAPETRPHARAGTAGAPQARGE
jgi:outer membrane protein assembly factor BamB